MAVGDLLYAFDPTKGETPQSIARKRLLAEAILGNTAHSPRDVGEGLNAIGQAILYRQLMKGADTADANGQAAASGAFASLFPQQFPPAPGSTPAASPQATDYPSQRVSQAFGDPGAPSTISGNPDASALVAALADPSQRARLPAGMRNNNPGNIKFVGQAGTRPSVNTDQGDPQAVYATPEDGMRAMYHLLGRKYAGGKTTANDIIASSGGWTPGNFEAAANVARNAGIRPDQDINFNDPQMAARFMRGLMLQEHGAASKLYPDSLIQSVIGAPPTAPAAAAVNAMAGNAPQIPPARTIQDHPIAGDQNLPVMAGGNSDAVTQTTAGPSIQQLAQVSANPYVQRRYGPVINAMLAQKMQQSDPGNQLDMQYKQAQIDALRAKPDQVPESVRALNLRAQQAGLVPGTKEYRDFMVSGGGGGMNVNINTASAEAAKAENQATSSDVITGAADKIRTLSKNPLATGMTGALVGNLANTDAAEVYRQIDVLKSNATIENLNAMRAASKTGGALGNVTEGEGKMLAAKTGALDPKSPYFQQQLDDYERTLLRIVHGKDAGDNIFSQTRKADPTASPAEARPRATNPKTGESLEWDGTKWAPVQ